MKKISLLPGLIVSMAVVANYMAPQVSSAQNAPTVFADGLNGPMGILVEPDGNIWVVDSGVGGDDEMVFPNFETYEPDTVKFGNTSRVIRIGSDGKQTEVASLPSFVAGTGEVVGGSRLAMLDGSLYLTSGTWTAGGEAVRRPLMASVVRIGDGEVTEVANTFDIESETNPDGRVIESNPFGLTAGPDGRLWVVDSAGNTLLTLDAGTGKLKMVALFDDLPSPIPNPHHDNKMETDAVPTAVAFDADGNAFVSFLTGFPFVPGSAKVVQLGKDGKVTDYATDLTMLVDLRTGPDGNMYAVSFGQFTEQGPVPQSGSVVRVKKGDASEEVVTGLTFPTSIDFNAAGDAYVSVNGLGAPGTGQVMMYRGLASAKPSGSR